jgi:prolyl-tRNA synthetase
MEKVNELIEQLNDETDISDEKNLALLKKIIENLPPKEKAQYQKAKDALAFWQRRYGKELTDIILSIYTVEQMMKDKEVTP